MRVLRLVGSMLWFIAPVGAEESIAAIKAELDAYLTCNAAAARIFAAQPDDAVSLAVAARGMCVPQEGALRGAMVRAYGVEMGVHVMDKFYSHQIDRNAGAIATERARLGWGRR
jgi:hypothetical protein